MIQEQLITILTERGIIDRASTPEDFTVLLHGGEGTRAVALLVDRATQRVTAAAKLLRDARSRDRMLREHYGLTTLHGKLPPHLRITLPRSLYLGPLDGVWAHVISGCEGHSLSESLRTDPRPERLVETLSLSLTWLADFQRETRCDPERRLLPSLRETLRESQWAASLSALEQEAFSRLQERIAPGSALDSWINTSHGALDPANLLWGKDQLAVINWEHFREEDFGYLDFARLFIGFLEIWGATTPLHLPPQLVKPAQTFLEEVGVGQATLPDILTLYWGQSGVRAGSERGLTPFRKILMHYFF
ncbi:MAG: hypothetical protein V3T77_03165 [Planctomycetota bacterium]